jgi:hemerythrin
MAYIEWREEFSVGVPSIDAQHRKLIGMINDMYDEYRGNKPASTVAKVLEEMEQYAREHFRTEEEFFDKFQYPDTKSHKNEHAVFINELGYFMKRAADSPDRIDIELLNFLREWFEQHILRKDKKYGPFLTGHGAE